MENEHMRTNVKNNEVDEHPVNSKNMPGQMHSAFAGFSPESEVHIVSFLVFFPLVLSFFHFCLPSNLLKCSPLSLIRQTQENVPLFVSLSLSLPLTLSPHL